MPLTAESPASLHILQNVSLILLAAFCAPLCSAIAIASWLLSPYTWLASEIERQRQWRKSYAPGSRRTVLVTGVGMSKGLAIARAFYRAGHRVVGADFEPYGVPVCGRFSAALSKFYRLRKPEGGSTGSSAYARGLVDIVLREKVELWISCSGVASAVEDGEAAEAVEKLTDCKAVQFGVAMTSLFHEKHSFIENTRRIGLNVPETHLIESVEEALGILHPDAAPAPKKRFIMKSVGLDDSIRADMSLLPFSSQAKTERHVNKLQPSPARPFVIQQFIDGPEFCTHALVVRGRVLAFTACASAELLMHYQALPPSSDMFDAMLRYTQAYAEKMGTQMSGHFSIDFLLDQSSSSPDPDLMNRIYPIECNPRAHTAVVLFADEALHMAEAYLAVLDSSEEKVNTTPPPIVVPAPSVGYYWIGHDLVTHLIMPLLSFLRLGTDFRRLRNSWAVFFTRVLSWQDGTYASWDPWPFWALYTLYWPGIFLASTPGCVVGAARFLFSFVFRGLR
ncbi:hypothetical protein MBM_04234 [Drepanopeziza brunnea f. sp. 'multigermtubi' MB_m1]|uniref:ATP-grasp domain-containing protein n=1 Tax=Marssonina brunnea f. sp. multigermtubi (strain MB_m1) TaxID=1072389 RepID=K1X9F2_MARBU|nr:uncharacterized protein MBM_04234 [Drepanopeziza brunnea f. sp. 'multigermtubi' MB_m1]EKD17373.1 hypothetical protein MBM_04234 [Drepanopeziza brunnea f. sp. 'multigermtubi' MB_m1]